MIRRFAEISAHDLPKVGGKGANLGVLTRAGFPVPPGFCITTDGFAAFVAGCAELPTLFADLDALPVDDVEAVRVVGAKVRAALLAVPLPAAVVDGAVAAWNVIGDGYAYAVRSSATAEDLPGASFAGQQDTYLNIRGEAALIDAIRRCFVSLFTDRAILYRQKNRFGHRGIALSVVVQRMVFPDAAGILFTADPVSGHRGTIAIDAGFGLGEALVSGLVTADLYRIDKATGAVKEVRVGDKAIAIRALPAGGTVTEPLSPSQREARVLDEASLRKLWDLARRVESHYDGVPQDVEWCLEGDDLFVVQARPITSLYPLPTPTPGRGLRVYFGFGHAQNMIAPMSPLGLDIWRTVFPIGKRELTEVIEEPTVMVTAGGRLYIDVTAPLSTPRLRTALLGALGAIYPDIARLLAELAQRPEIATADSPSLRSFVPLWTLLGGVPPRLLKELLWNDPQRLRTELESCIDEKLSHFRRETEQLAPGLARLARLRSLMSSMFGILQHFVPRFGSAMLSLRLLTQRFADTVHAADVGAIQRGVYGNVTTEMDLLVGDLTDLVRPHPELGAALRLAGSQPFSRESLAGLPGGAAFVAALDQFLHRFGMRGPGEIDIARPRYRDQPGLLFSSIIGGLSGSQPGAHRAHFARLQKEGDMAGERLIAAAGGPLARRLVARQVGCVRYGLGLREHPKYFLVRCLDVLRTEVLFAARELVAAKRLDSVDDVWLLRYAELLQLLQKPTLDLRHVVAQRRSDYVRYAQLQPPLVMTSDGEIPRLPPPKDLPQGALAGLGASAGVVEGLARVVLDPAQDVLHAGEILVAPYTDPGWTPLFVHAKGLVCEVGGMMTHGSVVAREYGIPAVVGVSSATRLIRSGQRIRIDGSRGLVEIIDDQQVPMASSSSGR